MLLLRRKADPPPVAADPPPVGGRRRAALLRRYIDEANAQRLTAEDVASLRQDCSPAVRARIATKFGRQFGELALSPQREMAMALLALLAKDGAAEVRTALAEGMAASAHLPHEVAVALAAADEIEIARPLLERSPVLKEADLIRLARASGLERALAVAGRDRVPEAVAAALAEMDEPLVAAKLVGNAGADVPDRALARILRRHDGHPEVEDRLLHRAGLPDVVTEDLIARLAKRTGWQLFAADPATTIEWRRTVASAMRERATLGPAHPEHSDNRILEAMRERHAADGLSHDDLLLCLQGADLPGFEACFALLTGFELRRVRKLLYRADRRGLAALCITAGLATPRYIMLRKAIDMAEATGGGAPQPANDKPRYIQIEYENLRRDQAKLRELLGM